MVQRSCDVRFVPKADILHYGKERRYSITLVSEGQERCWDCETERLYGLTVHYELKLRWLNDRKISRL